MTSAGSGERDPAASGAAAPAAPESARHLFGDSLPGAVRYAELLAGDGVAHGHIGPREVPQLWRRHLENCALVTDVVPADAVVLDVGSGAGLPGIPMALRRADLQLVLIEPKQRRCDFLHRCVTELGLASRVTVVRGRADDAEVRSAWAEQQWVTARAVAPLDRLVGWCLPLLAPRGRLLALKGASAAEEIDRHRDAIRRAGGSTPTVLELGGRGEGDPTWIVSVQRSSGARSVDRTARSRSTRRTR